MQAPTQNAVTDKDGKVSLPWRDWLRGVGQDVSRVGELRAAVGSLDLGPQGWLKCDGSAITKADYPALYGLISTITGTTPDGCYLPTLATVPSNVTTSGPPQLQWWVRAG